MYTKPIVFKIFSVVMLVCSCLSVIGGLITGLVTPSLGGNFIYWIGFAIETVITVFFAYVEFTCVFTFGRMVEHEQNGGGKPFERGLAFSGKFYKRFGTIVFYVALVFTVLYFAYIVLAGFFGSAGSALVFPIIPILIVLAFAVLVFVTYNCKFNTFGTLLNIKTAKEPAFADIEALKDTNPNTLRAYCTFLFYVEMIGLLGSLVLLLFIDPAICFALFFGFLAALLPVGITGCFFDNMAKMQEHYMIKYRLFNGGAAKKASKEGA